MRKVIEKKEIKPLAMIANDVVEEKKSISISVQRGSERPQCKHKKHSVMRSMDPEKKKQIGLERQMVEELFLVLLMVFASLVMHFWPNICCFVSDFLLFSSSPFSKLAHL